MNIPIPTVTSQDLAVFHQKHFGTGIGDSAVSPTFDQTPNDDDGLGYYEDGAKRTLTDEQIAMFRHSEIQELSKARRRKSKKKRKLESSRHSSDAYKQEVALIASNGTENQQSDAVVSYDDVRSSLPPLPSVDLKRSIVSYADEDVHLSKTTETNRSSTNRTPTFQWPQLQSASG